MAVTLNEARRRVKRLENVRAALMRRVRVVDEHLRLWSKRDESTMARNPREVCSDCDGKGVRMVPCCSGRDSDGAWVCGCGGQDVPEACPCERTDELVEQMERHLGLEPPPEDPFDGAF